MNVFSRFAVVASLVSVLRADHGGCHDDECLHVELVETWDTFATGLYFATVGIEYNSDDNLYYVVNWNNASQGEVGTLSGDYPLKSDDINLQQDVMGSPITGFGAQMVYNGELLFIGDLFGLVHEFSTATNEYIGYLNLGYQVNGLCADPDNPSMLYATSAGLDFENFGYIDGAAGLWSLDTSVGNMYTVVGLDDTAVTRLYDSTNATTNGFEGNYVFNPTRCEVLDGVVYMVEWKFDGTGSLGTYNIATGELAYDNSVLSVSCDGLAYSADVEAWFASTWGAWLDSNFFPVEGAGSLLALDTTEENAYFETVLTGLNTPQDIAIGPDGVHGTIAIASSQSGTIYFAEFEREEEEPTTTSGESDDSNSSSVSKIGVVAAAFAVVVASLF